MLVLGPPPVVIQEDRKAESRFCVARSYDEGAGAYLPLSDECFSRSNDERGRDALTGGAREIEDDDRVSLKGPLLTMYDGINAQFAGSRNVVAYLFPGFLPSLAHAERSCSGGEAEDLLGLRIPSPWVRGVACANAKGRKWAAAGGGRRMVAMGGGPRCRVAPSNEGMCCGKERVALAMCGLCPRDPPSLDEMSFRWRWLAWLACTERRLCRMWLADALCGPWWNTFEARDALCTRPAGACVERDHDGGGGMGIRTCKPKAPCHDETGWGVSELRWHQFHRVGLGFTSLLN
ncbi:hypothetical protein B0H14DRAFT_2586410 [Mycena olivaceomarginata]|nr:hypothetical protein B0H14DRAFT_2586410 [Mycena olivaceomarginata]